MMQKPLDPHDARRQDHHHSPPHFEEDSREPRIGITGALAIMMATIALTFVVFAWIATAAERSAVRPVQDLWMEAKSESAREPIPSGMFIGHEYSAAKGKLLRHWADHRRQAGRGDLPTGYAYDLRQAKLS